MDAEQLIREFLAEAEELVFTLEPNLLRLEKDPNNHELLEEIFLATHSMKGTAAYVGLTHISSFTHAFESLLEPLRTGRARPSPELIDLLLHGVDTLKALIQHVAQGQPAPDTAALAAQLTAWHQDLMQRSAEAGTEALRAPAFEAEAPVLEDRREQEIDPEECEIFADIGRQQLELMRLTLGQLRVRSQAASAEAGGLRESLAALSAAFRTMQSSAAMLDSAQLDAALSAQELAFTGLETAAARLTDEELERLEQAIEALETVIAGLVAESQEAESPVVERRIGPPAAPPLTSPEGGAVLAPLAEWSRGRYTLRVETERVDELLNLVGELVISRARLAQVSRELKGLYDEWRAGDLAGRQGASLRRSQNAREFKKIKERLDETTGVLGRLTNHLQEATMRIRMVPISQVVSRFPRMVRDLSRQAGKEVEILISGAETELDKTVVDLIGDPLIHLLRNAIDHGIEPPEERMQRGKARQGVIRLSAYYEGNQATIVVQDDGRGLDLERLKQKAVQRGVLSAREAETLPERAAMELIFASGMSTVETVSSLSGRGVGLNVVKRAVEQISGAIEFESLPGKGCTFLIKLPLTLAIIPALTVRAGAEVFVIPLMAVEEAIRCEPQDVQTIEAQPVLRLRERMIPVFDLAELLGRADGREADGYEVEEREADRGEEQYYGVILSDGLREIGVRVDALFGEGDMVIKSLRHDLLAVEGIAGASIRGDGRVALVIDAASLINLAIRRVKTRRQTRAAGSNAGK